MMAVCIFLGVMLFLLAAVFRGRRRTREMVRLLRSRMEEREAGMPRFLGGDVSGLADLVGIAERIYLIVRNDSGGVKVFYAGEKCRRVVFQEYYYDKLKKQVGEGMVAGRDFLFCPTVYYCLKKEYGDAILMIEEPVNPLIYLFGHGKGHRIPDKDQGKQ